MKPTILFLFTIAILVITTNVVMAQPALPSAPSQAPIDGGLLVLAAAGGTYAINKLRKSNNI